MLSYIKITEDLISKIKIIADQARTQLKPLILELAVHLEVGIKARRPEILNKLQGILAQSDKPRGQEEITIKLICQLIKKIKSQHFPNVSNVWIEKVLPSKYKEEARNKPTEKLILSEHITDANLYQILPDIENRIRRMKDSGPSKDIKIKETVGSISSYTWKCPTAQELARLSIKMEKEHEKEHDENYCLKSSKAIRMARDGRYATTMSRYQAIIIGAEHTKSLANVAEGEFTWLQRWQVETNERKCTECLSHSDCASRKCNHVCHEIIKKLTTKGVKWAVNTNEELKVLQKRMRRLENQSDDMCDLMKVVFNNPYTGKKLNQADKKTLMARHVDIKGDDCDQCLMFISDHPDFFREGMGK